MKSVAVLVVVCACLAGAATTFTKGSRPAVSEFSFSPSTFPVAPATAASAGNRRATTIRFKLSSRAAILIRIAHKRSGRISGRRCVKSSAKLRKRRACTRYVTVGTLVRKKDKGGWTTIPFSGRVASRTLKPGSYRATIVAIDKSRHRSKRKTARFKVVRASQQFPNPGSTGVPAGITLTPYTGPSTITTSNTVIDGKTMGCIEVQAPAVVIRNSLISCAGGGVDSGDGAYIGTPLLIEDSEIDCRNAGGTALSEANITARRVDIHGCENGGDINQNFTIEDSYIHDLYNSPEAHTDGVQFASGHFENGHLVGGSLNVTITHNTIYGMGSDGSFGTSAIISNRGGDTNVLIENNLLAGGAYTLYCEQDAKGTNYRVINNHFSRVFSANVGFFGFSTDCSDEQQSGNVIHETGQLLTLR